MDMLNKISFLLQNIGYAETVRKNEKCGKCGVLRKKTDVGLDDVGMWRSEFAFSDTVLLPHPSCIPRGNLSVFFNFF